MLSGWTIRFTVMSIEAVTSEPSMALPVMVTVFEMPPPVLMPVTTPLLSTVATDSSLDDHSRVR